MSSNSIENFAEVQEPEETQIDETGEYEQDEQEQELERDAAEEPKAHEELEQDENEVDETEGQIENSGKSIFQNPLDIAAQDSASVESPLGQNSGKTYFGQALKSSAQLQKNDSSSTLVADLEKIESVPGIPPRKSESLGLDPMDLASNVFEPEDQILDLSNKNVEVKRSMAPPLSTPPSRKRTKFLDYSDKADTPRPSSKKTSVESSTDQPESPMSQTARTRVTRSASKPAKRTTSTARSTSSKTTRKAPAKRATKGKPKARKPARKGTKK